MIAPSASNTSDAPILYSLQNCPYAMRARLALLLSEQAIIIRAISLKDKPQVMLNASPKGTVPVLILPDGKVIDESIDIMLWALEQHDPKNLLQRDKPEIEKKILALIAQGDAQFKHPLEQYRAAKRYHRDSEVHWREQCERFIQTLEKGLSETGYFIGSEPSLADYSFIPFMRQFGRVDKKWFAIAPYPKLKTWLSRQLQSQLYAKMMVKHEFWSEQSHNCYL